MRRDEIQEGKLVWFTTDEGISRVGLVGNITTKGSIKADILWQKSGENYTVKRTPIDKVQKFLEYLSEKDERKAIKNYCKRVLKVGANPTGSAKTMAKKYK